MRILGLHNDLACNRYSKDQPADLLASFLLSCFLAWTLSSDFPTPLLLSCLNMDLYTNDMVASQALAALHDPCWADDGTPVPCLSLARWTGHRIGRSPQGMQADDAGSRNYCCRGWGSRGAVVSSSPKPTSVFPKMSSRTLRVQSCEWLSSSAIPGPLKSHAEWLKVVCSFQ